MLLLLSGNEKFPVLRSRPCAILAGEGEGGDTNDMDDSACPRVFVSLAAPSLESIVLAWYSIDSQGDFGGVAGGLVCLPSTPCPTTRVFEVFGNGSICFDVDVDVDVDADADAGFADADAAGAPAAFGDASAEGQFFGELDSAFPRRLVSSIARCRLVTRESRFSGDDFEEVEFTDMLSELELVARCATLFLILWRAEVGV